MDDVDDLFPRRPPPATDPTLSADGLDGLFDDQPDALAVDTVAELFDSSGGAAPQRDQTNQAAANVTPDATLDVDDDMLDAVEGLFEPAEAADSSLLVEAALPSEQPQATAGATSIDSLGTDTDFDPVSTPDDSDASDSDANIGELVASLADELQRIEVALRSSDDDSER